MASKVRATELLLGDDVFGRLLDVAGTGASVFPFEGVLQLYAPLPFDAAEALHDLWEVCDQGALSLLDQCEERVASMGFGVRTPGGERIALDAAMLQPGGLFFFRMVEDRRIAL